MRVFNTLSAQKEEFVPQGDVAKMYVCGITPYDEAHLGHAMSYIIFDTIRRYLLFRGYKVKYIQNVTDIDDKIINRANRQGVLTKELAEKFTSSFFEDLKALNIMPADFYPRATGEIDKILEIVKGLVDKGYAYEANGSVYFRVTRVEDYGKLSHRTLDSMMSGARIEPGEEKEHPMDFVLWKASKPGEPAWDSPWGPGRPGWHIECSAMSMKYLGETLDIHGGGQDLIFPHHENEMAQSESFTGKKPFVRYWLHNGLVQIGEEKMSKSLGNLVTIKEALTKYSADGIRVFVLSSHYRSPLTYSEEVLEAAERGADRLRQTANNVNTGKKAGKKIDAGLYRNRFIEAMDDDFNSPQALAAVFDLAREINKYDSEGRDTSEARQTFFDLARVLGLTFETRELPVTPEIVSNLSKGWKAAKDFAEKQEKTKAAFDITGIEKILNETSERLKRFSVLSGATLNLEEAVEACIDARNSLRSIKEYQIADFIRNKLDEAGIVLEDTPKGTVWKRKR